MVVKREGRERCDECLEGVRFIPFVLSLVEREIQWREKVAFPLSFDLLPPQDYLLFRFFFFAFFCFFTSFDVVAQPRSSFTSAGLANRARAIALGEEVGT